EVDRRRSGGHERARTARHRDREQDRETSDADRQPRHRKHRTERSDHDSHRSWPDDHTSKRDRRRSPRSRSPARSRSPHTRKRRRHSPSASPPPPRKSRTALPTQEQSFRRDMPAGEAAAAPPEKQRPNFKPTGLLAKEANTVTIGSTKTILKYHEPAEARKPPAHESWRLYVFHGKDLRDTIPLATRSVWLCGRDVAVTDLLVEDPSVAKQHAVVQFRYLVRTDEFGGKKGRVRPYVMDLESKGGTRLNGSQVEAGRYVELLDGDVLGFGAGGGEYVVMLPPAAA
ncbi:hypothetical protein LTR53_000927, partial [Teratosphaeriaceae sp. CCFEE 6253]